MSWERVGMARRTTIALGIWAATAAPLAAAQDKTPELDVPYVPTRRKAVDEMLRLAKVTAEDYVVDLGCGDGRIVIAAAKRHKARGLGVDLDPKRVRESKRNASKAGVTDLVTFRKADVMDTDVRQASVVTLFLLEDINVRLRPKLFTELKPATRVVSNSFSMRDWKADQEVRHPQAYSKVIYLWIIPAPVGGTWTWQTKLAGKAGADSLKLEQEFQAVRGTVSLSGAAGVPIAEASLAGKELRFTASLGAAREQVVVAYKGAVDGDVIRGTQEWRAGPHAGTHPWLATRKPVDLIGRWQVRAPAHPEKNGTLRIRREAAGLKATYVRDKEPKEERALRGFYAWGSSIRFEVPLNEWSTLAFSGSLGPNAGGGNVGREQSQERSTWSAKRLAGN